MIKVKESTYLKTILLFKGVFWLDFYQVMSSIKPFHAHLRHLSVTANQMRTRRIDDLTRMRNTMEKMTKKFSEQSIDLTRKKSKSGISKSFYFRQEEIKMNPKILARERRVAGVLLKELNDLIQSCIVDSFPYESGVKITDIIHCNKMNCIVIWDVVGGEPTDEINEHLNKKASLYRSCIINAQVVGKVPQLYFRIDGDKKNLNKFYSVLEEEAQLPIHKNPTADNDEYEVNEYFLDTKQKSAVLLDTTDFNSIVTSKQNKGLTVDMFGINQAKLMERVYRAKHNKK